MPFWTVGEAKLAATARPNCPGEIGMTDCKLVSTCRQAHPELQLGLPLQALQSSSPLQGESLLGVGPPFGTKLTISHQKSCVTLPCSEVSKRWFSGVCVSILAPFIEIRVTGEIVSFVVYISLL